jgi:hypothetical protein
MNRQAHKSYNRLFSIFLNVLLGFLIIATVFANNGATVNSKTVADFDGDGKTDISVFRPSDRYWYISKSSSGYMFIPWGLSSDKPMPGDYDGDGKTDIAVWREGIYQRSAVNRWYILRSSDYTFYEKIFGQDEGAEISKPLPPADYNGDGKIDLANLTGAFDSSGNRTKVYFEVSYSSTNSGLRRELPLNFFATIVSADYDGDGKADFATYNSNGLWTIEQSSNGTTKTVSFGFADDTVIPADYDGDGKADIAVWRPSNGYWYWLSSRDGSFNSYQFGLPEDKPQPGDYDGDGKTDIAVFRPSNGVWYLQQSTKGFRAEQFGLSGDVPLPNVFVR